MVDFTRRVGLGRPLTYQEADDNFEFVEEQADLAEAAAIAAANSAIEAQQTVDGLDFTLDSLQNQIRNLQYGSGPYPSLDLLFTGAGIIDPRIVFERATPATYFDEMGVLRTAGPNEPRIDYDPATGECRGLLVEGQATNLNPDSSGFASWSDPHSSREDNAAMAPDGSLTATKLILINGSTPADNRGLMKVFSETGVNTISVFAKKGEFSFVSINAHPGSRARFNLETGEITTHGTASHASCEPVRDGWFRCSATYDFGSEGKSVFIQSDQETGDGVSGVYIWGAQLEEGSTPTSYIKTEASQVTRVADSARISTEDFWIDPKHWTLVVDAERVSNYANHSIIKFGDSADSNLRGIGVHTTSFSSSIFAARSPTYSALSPGVAWPTGERKKGALAFSYGGSANLTVDGSSVTATIDEDPSLLSYMTHLYLAGFSRLSGPAPTNVDNKRIYSVRVYPRALSDAELQALTSS